MKWSYKKILFITPLFFVIFWQVARFLGNYNNFINMELRQMIRSLLATAPLDIVTFLLFYFYFAPKFFRREHLYINIGLSVIYTLFWSLVWVLYFNFVNLQSQIKDQVFFISGIGHTIIYVVYGIIIRIGIEWIKALNENEELEKQNAKTELALLRSQINPHFLFNSLNNIHAYSKKDPDKSGFAIIKLSEIMRYMLYDANKDFVHLYKEVNYISDFIELQKMRFDFDFIDYKISPIPDHILIAPLIFIPFVENAFKHGRKDENAKIKISITYENNVLQFYCYNIIRKSTHTEEKQVGGIGIKNIKRRLELIYPERYKLEIKETPKEYQVFLTLTDI